MSDAIVYEKCSSLESVSLDSDYFPFLWDIHRKNTGLLVDIDSCNSSRDRRDRMRDQSIGLAKRLESVGYDAFISKPLSFVGSVTGYVEEGVSFRPICFLPSVAKQKRHSMLRDLTYWQQHAEGGKWLRYLVITNGELTPISELGSNIRSFNRKISKWADRARRDFGIEVVFRGLEFPFKADSKVHLHANVLYLPLARLSSERFSSFLSWTHRYFGTVLHDSGRLKEPREAIKYPFKPNDLDDASNEDLKIIAEQVFGQRIIESLGLFRRWRCNIRDRGLKTVYDDGRLVLAKSYKRDRVVKKGSISKSNRLVGIIPPMAHGSYFREPVLIIEGDPKTVFENDESLRATCEEFRYWWDQNGGPAVSFSLDNRTLSVQEKIDFLIAKRRFPDENFGFG